MGFRIIFFTCLFVHVIAASGASETPEYQLIQFFSTTSRNWTFEELASKLGEPAASLPLYVCDGKKEFELFPSLPFPNLEKNSLRVANFSDQAAMVYRDGEFYDPSGKTKSLSAFSPFGSRVRRALERLEKTTTGHALLRSLEASPYAITISPGYNHFGARTPGQARDDGILMALAIQSFVTLNKPDDSQLFSQIGCGGLVFWDPETRDKFTESDGKRRTARAEVVLAHELFHAWDAVRGLLDLRHVDGPSLEFASVAEYRATFVENSIRRELGDRYRKNYGELASGRDLLDKEGEPFLVPAPCLVL